MKKGLVAEGVSFAYPGAGPLFERFSLEVEPGERVALVAPSGRGKTTLCRVLAGYLQPQAGRVLADGEPVVRTRGPRPVQLVWQHPEQALDPRLPMGRSLAQTCAGGRRGGVRSDRVEELLERFAIRDEWLSRYPHELSGGELMRFCMVRALAPRPRYVVLDEATAMLDALTQAQLMRAVMDLVDREGLGMVLVSHSPALLARVATREVRL